MAYAHKIDKALHQGALTYLVLKWARSIPFPPLKLHRVPTQVTVTKEMSQHSTKSKQVTYKQLINAP